MYAVFKKNSYIIKDPYIETLRYIKNIKQQHLELGMKTLGSIDHF